jgi:hypothetical protein
VFENFDKQYQQEVESSPSEFSFGCLLNMLLEQDQNKKNFYKNLFDEIQLSYQQGTNFNIMDFIKDDNYFQTTNLKLN